MRRSATDLFCFALVGLVLCGAGPAHGENNLLRNELIGIVVDGEELDTELAYRRGERFYLATDLLMRMGVQGYTSNGPLIFATPGGQVKADRRYFHLIGGEAFFDATLLNEVLKIHWEFSAENYALKMILPWWQEHKTAGDLSTKQGQREVDLHPSSFGLTQIRLDHTQLSDQQRTYSYTDMLLSGRLAEGVWRGQITARENRDVGARDYYWLRDFEHVQALVGNQQILINPLLPAFESTGIQALYSTEQIRFDPYQDQTRSQYIRRFGIPIKDIEGISQPGAIAELRIDQRPVARTRVKLDGTYRFDRVRSSSLQFQTVRVHILDQRSFVELYVQDFTRTPMDLLLDRGQTVAFGGVGARGNPLDPVYGTRGEAAYGLVRYGLTDYLTMEAGLQSAGGDVHEVVGLSASVSRNWATTLSLGNHKGSHGYTADLFGRGDRWQVTARSQNYADGFRAQASTASEFSEMRMEYRARPGFSVGMHGRATQSRGRKEDYLLPGFSWRFNRRNVVRVWPDFDGAYRVDVRTSHRQRDWFEFVHDSSGERAEYRLFQNANLEYFVRLTKQKLTGNNRSNSVTTEIGSIWYPNVIDDRAQLSASLLASSAGMGYRFAWQTTVIPGLFSSLELRDEPLATEFSDRGLQLRWTLSVDLAISRGRPIPARNGFTQSRVGSIGGRLTLGNGDAVASDGFNKVAILINGRPHTAVLRGKYYFVANLLPGDYEVSLDSKYLPMALTPERKTLRVRVVSAATTRVDFVVNYEYGLSGRVTDATSQALVSQTLGVWDLDENLLATTHSDDYGYYQFSGLAPGEYLLRVKAASGAVLERRISVVDTFIFDADLSF